MGEVALQWATQQADIQALFASLRQSGELSDVTLTNGSCTLKCHRLVLSAACPSFHDVLKSYTRDVVLYMGAVSSAVLEALVEFMYRGRVPLQQQHLPEFLQLAKQWGLRGLWGDGGLSIAANSASAPVVADAACARAAREEEGGGGGAMATATSSSNSTTARRHRRSARHSSSDSSDMSDQHEDPDERHLNPSVMSALGMVSSSATTSVPAPAASTTRQTPAAPSVRKTAGVPLKAAATSSSAGEKSTNSGGRRRPSASRAVSAGVVATCSAAVAAQFLPMWKCPHCVRPKFVQLARFKVHLLRVHGDSRDPGRYRSYSPDIPARRRRRHVSSATAARRGKTVAGGGGRRTNGRTPSTAAVNDAVDRLSGAACAQSTSVECVVVRDGRAELAESQEHRRNDVVSVREEAHRVAHASGVPRPAANRHGSVMQSSVFSDDFYGTSSRFNEGFSRSTQSSVCFATAGVSQRPAEAGFPRTSVQQREQESRVYDRQPSRADPRYHWSRQL